MNTRIFLLEGSDQTRDAVSRVLRSNGYAVSSFTSAVSFIASAAYESTAHGGCIIADMGMVDLTGPELLNVLAADHVRLPVVFTTAQPDVHVAVESMRYGASYVIQKPFSDRELLATIMLVIAEYYAPGLTQRGRPSFEGLTQDVEARLASLSMRQREILLLVYEGKLNKAIASRLGISVKTVELHRGRMMQKMQASSLIELIKMMTPCRHLLTGPDAEAVEGVPVGPSAAA